MHHYNLGTYLSNVLADKAERPALIYAERRIKYSELADWVEALSALLIIKGCERGDVIAIGHNKRPLSYALMLAALRLGIAYVNIDVASPLARTAKTLELSGASLLFYDDSEYKSVMEELAAAVDVPLILLAETMLPEPGSIDPESDRRLVAAVDGSTIAYIMFTSGSTGVPKGVAVTHQNLLHFIAWGQDRFGITDEDNFANLSPMYFDNSVFDFYIALFSGASLSPVSRELLESPYELVPYVGKMGCSIWFSVPSLLIYLGTMKAMVAAQLPGLRTIVFGGEGYPKVELKKLYDQFSKQAELVNVYGPTECTCICSAYTLTDQDFDNLSGLPTLGHLNPNFDYRIINDDGKDASSGELCLIGPIVAAGYFNEPERTSASFITITEPSRFMKRMYHTGDLVKEKDGKLYFVGRKDNQIKHMGYRIELEEIEHALTKLPQIDQAAAIYHRQHTAYGKIVGFLASTVAVDEQSLLKEIAEVLPGYMLPSKLIIVPELPKNPNGKVDRQQLHKLVSGPG